MQWNRFKDNKPLEDQTILIYKPEDEIMGHYHVEIYDEVLYQFFDHSPDWWWCALPCLTEEMKMVTQQFKKTYKV